MKKAFTVKQKTILMRHADKRKRIKRGSRMKHMMKFMIMKRKSANRDKIATNSMPRVLHPVEKSVVIPDDVIPDILVKLTVRSVGRLRCVCKSWLSITTNLSFIRAHAELNRFTNQSLIVDGGLNTLSEGYYLASVDSNTDLGITLCKLHEMGYNRVIASCDGLLYISIFYNEYIINPLTGYSISVPSGDGIFLGFYFHRSTSKYRIIKGTNEIVVMTDMLVVGERSWRHLSCRLPCRLRSNYHKSLDLNGCLLWLAFKVGSHCKQPDTIMAFDTESEVYNMFSLPPSEKLLNIVGNLVDFKGELGLWVADNNTVDVWIKEDCWVKRYSINYFNLTACSVQFGRLEDYWVGGAAVFTRDEEFLIDLHDARYFIRCNLKSGACYCHERKIVCSGSSLPPCACCSYPYMETLAYPDSFSTFIPIYGVYV